MTTYHILKRLRPRGGNQFYRDRSVRKVETFCGGEPNGFSVQWHEKAVPWSHGGEDHEPCAECVRLRGEFKQKWDATPKYRRASL